LKLKKGVVLCIALLFAHSVIAASNWQQTSIGTCATAASQCLVSNAFNPALDNIPNSYWDGLVNPSTGPKCIASGQFILDHYCDSGVWSSRTKQVALRLVALAQSASVPFSISCGRADLVLPHDELTNSGSAFALLGKSCSFASFNGVQFVENCANNVCVLKYGNAVALGMSVNSQINGPTSVLRVFNKPITLCTTGIDTDAEYASCGSDLWYDHRTQSVIYAPGVFRLPLTAQVPSLFLDEAYERVSSYVFANVHNPSLPQKNYSSFQAPDLSEVYYAQGASGSVFAFRQSKVTLLQTDYFGAYFATKLPADVCAKVFKRFDDRSQCEVQPNPNMFFVVASKSLGGNAGIVDAYPSLVGSLRVV